MKEMRPTPPSKYDIDIALPIGRLKGFLGALSRLLGFERQVQKGVTNPGVAKLDVPPAPKGMNNADFGKDVIGWYSGPKGAISRTSEITPEEIVRMQQMDLTKELATAWRDFYTNDFVRNARNLAAK